MKAGIVAAVLALAVAGGLGVVFLTDSRTATGEPSGHVAASTDPTPSTTATTQPLTGFDPACFDAGEDASQAPRPSGEPPHNPGLLDRLPSSAFGEPLDRRVIGGDWLLADPFFGPLSTGFLSCTGAELDDMWIGMANGEPARASTLFAFEIEGHGGTQLHDMMEAWLAEMGGEGDVVMHEVERDGRRYTQIADWTGPYAILYATDRTLYYIAEFCCVDYFGEAPPEIPLAEIHLELLDGLPSN